MAGTPAARGTESADALLAQLTEQNVVGIAEIDFAAGRVLRMSSGLAELLGAGPETQQARQLVLLAGQPGDAPLPGIEARLKTEQHGFVPIRLARIPLPDDRTLLLIGRAGGDAAAEQAVEDYREIYETISDGIYRSSIDGRQLSANPALVRLNGYDSEAEMLPSVHDIAREWYVEPTRRAEFQRLLHANGRVEDFVSEVHRHKSRERIWVSENARLVRDPETGVPLYYEGTVRDVTETVRRLRAEERLRTVVETIADGVLTAEIDGTIESANCAAETLFGRTQDELVGRNLAELVDDGSDLRPPALGTRRAIGRRSDGCRLTVDLTVARADGSGGPMLVCYLRDITEQLRTEVGLQEAKEAAERAASAKAEFLAVMSHELRTPLNAVVGMAGLLLDGALDAAARRHAETLREAADHLLEVVNDVLDFSKLDAERLTFEAIQFELPALLQGTVVLMAPRAHAKGLELCADLSPALPVRVIGDPARLRQVLVNLLSNAIKFTDRGTISVEAEWTEADSGPELAVAVHDTGIGIAPEQMPALFQAFSQADTSVSRRFGGTGLGLAICARLVAGMGGGIGAESTLGHGSTFRFTVRPRPAPPERIPPPLRLDGTSVLVVDDNLVNRRIFVRQLEQRGATAISVADPAAALTALAANSRISAAVIDHAMPGGDGIELGRRIRALGRTPMRLVLATSCTVDEPTAGRDGTFDAVLTKPVPVDALVRALSAPLPPAADTRPAATAATLLAPPERALRVLLAEDNAANQAVFRAMLERLGHRVDIVGSGIQALTAVTAQPYDVVLMDVMMPELDGASATRRLRALPAPAGAAPVIGLTAHVGAEEHASFRAAGMDVVLTKPVTVAALAAALRSVTARAAMVG